MVQWEKSYVQNESVRIVGKCPCCRERFLGAIILPPDNVNAWGAHEFVHISELWKPEPCAQLPHVARACEDGHSARETTWHLVK